MISEKQWEANKENAKTGGIKTAEGKAISKFNALKHGLLSREVLLAGENESELDDLRRELYIELQPINFIEFFLADRIVANIWRLRRALRVEREQIYYEMLCKEQDIEESFLTSLDGKFSKKDELAKAQIIKSGLINEGVEKMLGYETTIERQIYRALHELTELRRNKQLELFSINIKGSEDFKKG